MNEKEYDDFRHELGELRKWFNSMQCPDCGGLHTVRLSPHKDGTVSRYPIDGLWPVCSGYTDLVNQSIRTLQSKYGIER